MAGKMADLLKSFGAKLPTPGELLRAFRKREQFTLEDMFEITGVAVSNLSAIENGKIPMTPHYAEMFACALCVRPDAFLYPDGHFAKDERLLEIEHRANMLRNQKHA